MEWKKLLIVPKLLKRWSGRRGSNPRRPAWEAGILPLNYSRVPGSNQVESPNCFTTLSRYHSPGNRCRLLKYNFSFLPGTRHPIPLNAQTSFGEIVVRGARLHNLKNLTVSIPHN